MSGKKKRKKILPLTAEEKAAQEQRYQELLRLIERARIELETGKRPPPDPAPASR
jgi:hypothetical protein